MPKNSDWISCSECKKVVLDVKEKFMRKLLIACALCILAVSMVAAAPLKTIPTPVVELYTDMIKMIVQLNIDLGKATSAKAVAQAFDAATATVKSKKMAERYQQVQAQYPDFFQYDDDDDAEFNYAALPEGWATLYAEYAQAFEEYGMSMQNLYQFVYDARVQKAIEDFGAAMESLDGSNGDN